MCSISSPCFGIVRKHLKGILRIFEIFLQFPEKINNFLKKLRLFHFRFVFLLDSFLASPEGPQLLKNYWRPWKVQPVRALIFLEMDLLFSGFNVIFLKLQNGHILANKLNFEKLSQLSFVKLLKLEKIKCLYFCIFWLIFRDMAILWILPYYCSKSLFYSTFPQILTGEDNFVKYWLYSLFLKHNITLGCMNIDFYDGSKIGIFDTQW